MVTRARVVRVLVPKASSKVNVRWWLMFAVLFAMSAAWSLATPLTAAPDEPAHLIKAAAVARGQFFGRPALATPEGPSPVVTVRVPEVFARTHHLPACFELRPDIPASCAPRLTSGARLVSATTYTGRYAPLYYLAVGLPSLPFPSVNGMRLMRLLSALLCCIFLASAFESAYESSRFRVAVPGVAVAVTPMVLFLNGTVNPNSLEIASALCLWVSLLVLVTNGAPRRSWRTVTRSGLSAAVLVEMRGLSILWFALIVATALAVANRDRLMDLARDIGVRCWTVVVALSSAFSVWWTLRYDSLALLPVGRPDAHASFWNLVRTATGQTGTLLRETIGVAGWLDTPAPPVAYYTWVALAALLLAGGVLGSSRRARVERRRVYSLGCLVLATVIVPVVIEVSQARRLGFVWQGRYTLPLAVGIPVLAALSLSSSLDAAFTRSVHSFHRATALVAVAVGAVVFVAQGAMFIEALRRYTFGLRGPLIPFGGSWAPPLGAPALTAIFFVALLVYAALISATEQLGKSPEEKGDVLAARSVAHAADPPDLARHRAGTGADLDPVAFEQGGSDRRFVHASGEVVRDPDGR